MNPSRKSRGAPCACVHFWRSLFRDEIRESGRFRVSRIPYRVRRISARLLSILSFLFLFSLRTRSSDYIWILLNLRLTKPPRESVAFAAVTLARSEILIATLMFHSAARPFASIIDVHSIRRNFKGFSCLHWRKGGLARGCKISIVG